MPFFEYREWIDDFTAMFDGIMHADNTYFSRELDYDFELAETGRDFQEKGPTRLQVLEALQLLKPTSTKKGTYDTALGGAIFTPELTTRRERFPVVIISHGAHKAYTGVFPDITEIKSYLGYVNLQRTLADQGIVSVSINANFPNQVDSRIRFRADLILAHLDMLSQFNRNRGHRLSRRLDLARVALVGHSRGGDAATMAVRINKNERQGSKRYGIRGIVLLAPTDQIGRTDKPIFLKKDDRLRLLVLYGSRDGDVMGPVGTEDTTGTGFRHYDRATCDKSMIFIRGITHSRFNTIWQEIGVREPDNRREHSDPFHPHAVSSPCAPKVLSDCPAVPSDLRSQSDHSLLLREYVGGFLSWTLQNDTGNKLFFHGSRVPEPSSARDAAFEISVQWCFGRKKAQVLEIELEPGFNPPAPEVTSVTLSSSNAKIITFADDKMANATKPDMHKNVPHRTAAIELVGGGSVTIEMPTEHRNLKDVIGVRSFLTMRVMQWFDITSEKTISTSRVAPLEVQITSEGVSEPIKVNKLSSKFQRRKQPFFSVVCHPWKSKTLSKDPRTLDCEVLNTSKIIFETVAIDVNQLTTVNWENVTSIRIIAPETVQVPVYINSIYFVRL